MASKTTVGYRLPPIMRTELDRLAELALYADVLPCPECGSLALPCCDRR